MRFVYKIGIITLFATFFLMSHNAFAVDTTIDISNYNVVRSAQVLNINCKFNDGALDKTNVGICGGLSTNQTTVNLQRLYSNNSYTFKTGDIIEYDIAVYTDTGVNKDNGFTVRNGAMPEYPFRVLSVKQNSSVDSTRLYINSNTGHYGEYHYFYSIYHYELIYVGADDDSYQLGWRSGYGNLFEYTFGDYYFRLENFVQYRSSGESQINKEQSDATQNAADESESEAQDNSSNGQTTNLIGAFQSFVTALTSLNSTNCNVTLPFPSNLGGSMQVNICQNKDYAGNIVSVFGSLTLIVFYIPFSLKLLSMIYNEIRSFTNG